jgi:hypothetical protein
MTLCNKVASTTAQAIKTTKPDEFIKQRGLAKISRLLTSL